MAGFNYNDSIGGVSGSIEVSSSLNAQLFGVTGSLYGTSSWTENVTVTTQLRSADILYTADGELFDVPDFVWDATQTNANSSILTVGRQSDGKIIVAGEFQVLNSITNRLRIGRLNISGGLDTTFLAGGFNGNVQSIVVDAQDKIVCVGNFTSYNSVTANGIIRLNPNGDIDYTFLSGVGNADVKANGFCNEAGTLASSAETVIVSLTGGYAVVGGFSNYSGSYNPDNGGSYRKIIALNNDGTIDTSFNVGQADATAANRGFGVFGTTRDIKIHNGAYVVYGDLRRYRTTAFTTGGTTNTFLCRILATGLIDVTFTRPVATTNSLTNSNDSIAVEPITNNIFVGLGNTTFSTGARIVKLSSTGVHNATFNTTGLTGGTGIQIRSIALQSDGKLLIGGFDMTDYSGTAIQNILRVDPTTGVLDTTFIYGDGRTGFDSTCHNIFPFDINVGVDSYKQILMGGTFLTYNGLPAASIVLVDQYGGNIGLLKLKDSFPYIGTAQITGSVNVTNNIGITGTPSSATVIYNTIPVATVSFAPDVESPWNTTAVPVGACFYDAVGELMWVKIGQPNAYAYSQFVTI